MRVTNVLTRRGIVPFETAGLEHRSVLCRILGSSGVRRAGILLAMILLPALTPTAGAQEGTAAVTTGRTQAAIQSQAAPATTASDSSPFLQRRPRYRVAPGDVLALDFPFTPGMDQTVTIQPDGYVTLRDVGDFYAQGKTTAELASGLETSYSKILNAPTITVDLKNFQEPYFVVGGQVGHPGKYELRADTTVIEALAISGGLTPSSKHSRVLLFRRVNASTVEVRKLNVKRMLRKADLSEDVYLRPGDMIYVPKNIISKVQRFLPTSALSMYFSGKGIW